MKKRIYIDMDGTLCDYMGRYNLYRKLFPYVEYPQSISGFFSKLEPLEGAVESFKELSKRYDVWILTRPSLKNLHCYTEKAQWVKEFLGEEFLEKLILSPDKSLLIGDYLIDDYGGDGQSEFLGKWIHFGTGEFMNWVSVMNYFKSL